jgi:hypothetical protein
MACFETKPVASFAATAAVQDQQQQQLEGGSEYNGAH